MASLVMFCILAVVILGSAVMCVMTKRIMRSITFLLFVLLRWQVSTSCSTTPIWVLLRSAFTAVVW